jgi:hypothetical protein
MKTFSAQQRIDALVRRRIKFVVEKAAVARFFLAGTSSDLHEELFRALRPSRLAGIRIRDEYDQWLVGLIESGRWAPYSRNGLQADRLAYFAKVINIVTYEIVANRELFSQQDWETHSALSAFSDRWQRESPSPKARFWVRGDFLPQGMSKTAYWEFQTEQGS